MILVRPPHRGTVTRVTLSKTSNPSPLFNEESRDWLALGYTGSMALAGLLGFLKVFAYASVLDAAAFGLYGLGVLWSSFGMTFCHLGGYRGLDCLLPSLYGAQSIAEAHRLRNSAAGLVLLLSIVLMSATAIVATSVTTVSTPTRFVMMAAGLLAGANSLLGTVTQDQRSRGRTLAFGLVFLAKSVLNICCGLLLAVWWGCIGMLLAEAFVAVFLFLVVACVDCPGFRFAVPRMAVLNPALRTGTPLLFKIFINELALSLDRWSIPAALGIAALGQYNFGLIPVSAAMFLHNILWSSVGPHAARRFGRDQDAQQALRSIHRWTVLISIAAVIAWFPIRLVSNYFIPEYAPRYLEGGHLVPILYWGAFFQIINLYDWIPMVLQRTAPLVYVNLASLSITAVLLVVASALGWSLAMYAWIFVAGRAANSLGQLCLAVHMVKVGATRPVNNSSVLANQSTAA